MINPQKEIELQKKRRKAKIRARIKGRITRPRLSIYRSLKYIYAQIIDDEKGKTLASASDKDLPKGKRSEKKEIIAKEVGKLIAERALAKKIEKVVFDRRGLAYHGRVKALAEGAREGGLKF